MGRGWRSRLLPCRPTNDPYWPQLRRGSGHFDLSVEQLAQKVQKLTRSFAVQVAKSFDAGERRWFCPYWCSVAWHHGCGAACCCAAGCCEKRLSVQKGDWMLMSRREGAWSQVRPLHNGPGGVPGEDRGWVPHSCFVSGEYQRYELPSQRLLQGTWEVVSPAQEASAGSSLNGDDSGAKVVRKIRVMGALAQVISSKVAYPLRIEGDVGDAISLLGVRLLSVEGRTARWANGEVWQRPWQDPNAMSQSVGSARLRQRRVMGPSSSTSGAASSDTLSAADHAQMPAAVAAQSTDGTSEQEHGKKCL